MLRIANYFLLIAACVVTLSACSGGSQSTDSQGAAAQAKQLPRSQKTTASSPYEQVVEQLYVAYFGRPADPAGLTNFEAQLAAAGAPTTIQGLLSAYGSNATVKTLVDSFGNSPESQKLYGTTDPTAFVQAVFNNVLGRQPATAGQTFWVNALNSNSVTYGNAALSIMDGALTNTTAQGLIDTQLVNNRIAVATDFTADVSEVNAVCVYSGATAANSARVSLGTVTSNTASSSFETVASDGVNSVVATNANTACVVVDQGADPANISAIDQPFTSITICAPSNPSDCQTIDHVLVDTGSYGLRLIYSTLTPSIAAELTAQGNSNALLECTQFVDGYSWGPVRKVNFSIGGESVSNLNVQVIGDPNFTNLVPSSCSSSGPAENTVDTFGSNGVIGVGLFQQDCGTACVTSTAYNNYFTCSNTPCVGTTVSLANQVPNPISLFAQDNNGVIVSLPFAPQAGENSASGSMIFGVGTQSNNSLGSATVFQMNGSGYFTTIFNGTTMPNSFIDSGSNGLYFPNLTNIPTCSDGFYCPTSVITLTATMTALNNATNSVASENISFAIGDVDNALNSPTTENYAVYVPLGAPNSDQSSFDWGLPFFFGRNVIVVTENKTVNGQTGPFVAF